MRWYPASFNRPRTAFTFDLLETYHKVTLQGKLNLYDFYHSIMQKSDNQGRSKPLVRYLCVTRWLLLLMDLGSTGIMKFLVVSASGGTSRVSNVVVALIRLTPFLRLRLALLRSSVLPAHTLGETSQTIGTMTVMVTSETLFRTPKVLLTCSQGGSMLNSSLWMPTSS